MLPACACSRIRRASRALTRVYDEALGPFGLTTTQFAILRTLDRIGPSSVTELSRATGHERSAMTRSLRPLEQARHVAIGDGADPRSRAVALTDAGRAAIARAEPGWRSAQARVEERLGADDATRLFALLETVEGIGNGQGDIR